MLDIAINSLESNLTNLCWLQHYGGLTRLLKDPECEDDAIKYCKYPITCNPSFSMNECIREGQYKRLVPNSNYISIAYFEEINDMDLKEVSIMANSAKTEPIYTSRARLMIWVNLPKIGFVGCGFKSKVLGDLRNAINGTHIASDGSEVTARLVKCLSYESSLSQWSKYDWDNTEQLFFYPYEAMTFEVEFAVCVDENCFDSFECLEPIECINYAI